MISMEALIAISKLGHSKSDQALARIRVYHLEAKGSQKHYSMFILDMLIPISAISHTLCMILTR